MKLLFLQLTAFSSKVHICAEWWWQSVQLGSNGTLHQTARGYDFKSVAEMLVLKKISETLNLSDKRSTEKEGEAVALFKELISKESIDEHNSSLIQFHIRLLALILGDSKKESPFFSIKNATNSWLKHLEDLIMQSYHLLNDFPLDWFQEGISGYYKLDLSKKFKLMTLLCDEALNTAKLRSYIQDENSRHAKAVKEAKLKIAAAKEKCRQKKENFAAICKNLKKGKNRQINYCHRCLLTRYGENVEEVAQLANWTCPKCRGICNCSLCLKLRGEPPTGFMSVAEMLAMKNNLETSNPLNEGNLRKEPEVFLSGEVGNEHFSDANVTEVCTKDDGGENFGMNLESKTFAEEILLPPGMELKEIFGMKLPPKEVGNALQILEFCRVFGKG